MDELPKRWINREATPQSAARTGGPPSAGCRPRRGRSWVRLCLANCPQVPGRECALGLAADLGAGWRPRRAGRGRTDVHPGVRTRIVAQGPSGSSNRVGRQRLRVRDAVAAASAVPVHGHGGHPAHRPFSRSPSTPSPKSTLAWSGARRVTHSGRSGTRLAETDPYARSYAEVGRSPRVVTPPNVQMQSRLCRARGRANALLKTGQLEPEVVVGRGSNVTARL